MQRLAIYLLAAFFVFAAGFATGREWRDRSADVDTATRDTADAQSQTKAVADARTNDHASDQASAVVEQQHVAAQAATDETFRVIYRDVIHYVETAPVSPDACDLDADGLRIWRAANEGTIVASSEPGHTSGADGAVSRRPTAARKR